jgi:hypothetical protein
MGPFLCGIVLESSKFRTKGCEKIHDDGFTSYWTIGCFLGENYYFWKFRVQAILVGKDLYGIVDYTKVLSIGKCNNIWKNSQGTSDFVCNYRQENIATIYQVQDNKRNERENCFVAYMKCNKKLFILLKKKFYNLWLQNLDDLAIFMGKIEMVSTIGFEDYFIKKVVMTKLTCNL